MPPSCDSLSNTGAAILDSSGPPANTQGQDGDFYIDTVAHALYGPKAGGVWPAPVSLVGPAGAPGNGTNGTNGSNGTNGNTILSGAGAPPDTLGSDGDFYIDTNAHIMYGLKREVTGRPQESRSSARRAHKGHRASKERRESRCAETLR